MAQINREGSVRFRDAQISIWEEMPSILHYAERTEWEKSFRRDVFKRVIQTLNRLGWKCVIPQSDIDTYGKRFTEGRRYCVKGDLKGELNVSGRCIEFKMFQSVNCPTRPDHEGRYEWDKEKVMPYLLRLEMERTRRRIRDYLCNVFDGYHFDALPSSAKSIGPGPGQVTAMEAAAHARRISGHYVKELDRARIANTGQDKSVDGCQLENGVKVYAMIHNGRMISGLAFYSLNGNWQIVSGRYGLNYVWHNRIWVNYPGDLRARRDTGLRRTRLEEELAKAIKSMNFERASILRDILFPRDERLFMLRHKEHGLYHRPGSHGYTSDTSDAWKFMLSEITKHDRDLNDVVEVA